MNELELILTELAGTADGTSVPGGWAAGMERSPQGANEGRAMQLRKGMRIREATMRVGQVPQRGEILGVRGKTVDVRWDDGHVSSLTGGVLLPDKKKT